MAASTTILDFDSTHRNRTDDPNPGTFNIPIVSPSTTSMINDPVCTAMPLVTWTAGRFTVGVIGQIYTAQAAPSKSASELVYLLETGGNELQRLTGYYNGAVIEFADASQRRIVQYKYMFDNIGEFTLDRPIDGFAAGANVSIYDQSNLTVPTYIELFVPCGASVDNYYTGYQIHNENHNEYRIITRYNGTTHVAEIDSPVPVAWSVYDNYSIRMAPASLQSPLGVSTSTSQINIINGNTVGAQTLVRSFIRILGTVYGVEAGPNDNATSQIIAWDNNTSVATISPALAAIPVGGNVEVMTVTYDNLNKYVNVFSADLSTYYSMELLTLSIPRVGIISSYGGDITAYPYVYVRLANVSGSTPKNTFISNNANAATVQFRATLASNNNSAYFYKLTGDLMKQTIQIKTNDTLLMSIILPDGSVYVSALKDTTSPRAPNPLLQISATFAMTPTASR